jgi:MraZ protein
MLLREYRLSVDGAGRLRLPCVIRQVLHKRYAPDDGALIATTFFERCLVGFPLVEWLKAQETLHRMGASRTLIREFLLSGAVCLLDGEGRLYIPVLFRQHAEIERDVLLIGMICYLEAWSPQKWEEYVAEERW